ATVVVSTASPITLSPSFRLPPYHSKSRVTSSLGPAINPFSDIVLSKTTFPMVLFHFLVIYRATIFIVLIIHECNRKNFFSHTLFERLFALAFTARAIPSPGVGLSTREISLLVYSFQLSLSR